MNQPFSIGLNTIFKAVNHNHSAIFLENQAMKYQKPHLPALRNHEKAAW